MITSSDASKRTKIKSATKVESNKKESDVNRPPVRWSLYILGVILLLSLVGLGVYAFNRVYIAASVNHEQITRLEVIKELEKKAGKQALKSIITKKLILQEAKKKSIVVTKREVDDQIKDIETTYTQPGQTFDQILQAQGSNRQSLREDVETQKYIEKILSRDIKISDKEINDFIEKNKETILLNTNPKDINKLATQQLKQQKLSEKAGVWLADLEKKAQIHYYVNY